MSGIYKNITTIQDDSRESNVHTLPLNDSVPDVQSIEDKSMLNLIHAYYSSRINHPKNPNDKWNTRSKLEE